MAPDPLQSDRLTRAEELLEAAGDAGTAERASLLEELHEALEEELEAGSSPAPGR